MGVCCRSAHFLLAAFVLLAVSCARPASYERFIKAGEAVRDLYSFEIPLEDTLSTYDISFYTRVDGGPSRGCLHLDVVWVSPSGRRASETVYMNPELQCEKYRSGVSPKEAGEWRLEVRVQDAPEGFRGLGIICMDNGTRQASQVR